MRRMLGVLVVLSCAACSGHSAVRAGPTVTRTVMATVTASPTASEPSSSPSAQPDYCTMKNPPKNIAGTVVRSTGVISVRAAVPNPGGGVALMARQECFLRPGFGDDGNYWPTGPLRMYVVQPDAEIYLVDSGPKTVRSSLQTLIARAGQSPSGIAGYDFKIATNGSAGITRLEQLWHP